MAFEFKNNDTILELNGETFEINIFDDELLTTLEQIGSKVEGIQEKLKGEKESKQLKEILPMMAESIDDILGEGATKKIFKDRKINFLDLMDVINYISKELETNRNAIIDRYSPNRLER